MNNTNHFILFKTRSLYRAISTLQDKENELSLRRISPTGSKVIKTPIFSTLQDKQNEWSLNRVSPIDSKVRTLLVYGQLAFSRIRVNR